MIVEGDHVPYLDLIRKAETKYDDMDVVVESILEHKIFQVF